MYERNISRILIGIALMAALAAPAQAQSTQSSIIRAEQRADALRTQLLEQRARQVDLQDRLDDLDYRMTPEAIQHALAFVGSVRPMDELRAALRTRLENEKARVTKQLSLLEASCERLEAAIAEADRNVEQLRRRGDSE